MDEMETLIDYNDKLMGLPAGVIAFLWCIVACHATRALSRLSSIKISAVTIFCGAVFFSAMSPSRRERELRPWEEVAVARCLRDALLHIPLEGVTVSTNISWDDSRSGYLSALKYVRDDLRERKIATIVSPTSIPLRIWITRNWCIGAFIGLVAWLAHRGVIRRIEKRLGIENGNGEGHAEKHKHKHK